MPWASENPYREENRRILKIIAGLAVAVCISGAIAGLVLFDTVQAEICTSKNPLDNAVASCESVAATGWIGHDKKVEVWKQLSEAYWQESKLDQGIAFYERLIAEQPSDLYLLLQHGKLLSWNKDFEKAKPDLEKVLVAMPDDQDAALSLASIENGLGNSDKAIKILSQSATITPPSNEVYRSLANYYRGQKRLDIAAYYAELAIEKDPENAYAYNELGLVFDAQGHRQAAIVKIDKALEVAPDTLTFLDNKGLIQIEGALYAEAEKTYRHIVELDNTSSGYRLQLASTLRNQSRLDEAKLVLERANADFPDTPSILVDLVT
jgi:tetratricopeptide (TPR) repeat protein